MITNKKAITSGLRLALGLTLLGGVLSAANAGGVKHPHYLHALSDLRAARGWLTALGENNVMGREMDAVVHIDRGIGEIKKASIDDGKDLHDHPPVDTSVKHKGRLHKALSLLLAAKKDVDKEEDDPQTKGLQRRANGQIAAAIKATRQAINDVKNDS